MILISLIEYDMCGCVSVCVGVCVCVCVRVCVRSRACTIRLQVSEGETLCIQNVTYYDY